MLLLLYIILIFHFFVGLGLGFIAQKFTNSEKVFQIIKMSLTQLFKMFFGEPKMVIL